jgi:tetratricopeptide (TPR) repeat protein
MARATRPAPDPSQILSPRAADGRLPAAARALTTAALGLLGLRVVVMFVPGRWLWGFDLGRDLPPASFWLPIALTAVAFVPGVAEAFERAVPHGARALAALAMVLGLALALFLWAHPDLALYNGDTSLRHGAFIATDHPEQFAEQALRGDLVLHHALPRWFAAHTPWSAEVASRLQGVLLAFLTVLATWQLAVAAGVSGAAALAVMAVAVATGALALDNGYSKATVELALLTTLLAVGVARAARDGGGLLLSGLAVAAALQLHRSAIALLPAWLACTGLALRAGRAREWTVWVGIAAPLASLAAVGPSLVHILVTFDATKHLHGAGLQALAFAFRPAQLLDAANALGVLLPLAPIVPVLLVLPPRRPGREAFVWGALVLPLLALLFLVQPQHGLPRDWDVFACTGSALAAFAAWRVAQLFAAEPRARALALPLACVALVPALQWAALQNDPARAWARAESVLLGPPLRDANERAYGFATIGMLCLGRGQVETARRMFQRSAEAEPDPSTFVRWGVCESRIGHHAEALARYRQAAELDPRLVTAWRGIAAAGSQLGDRVRVQEAVRHLEELEPGNETLRAAKAWLEEDPAGQRHERP